MLAQNHPTLPPSLVPRPPSYSDLVSRFKDIVIYLPGHEHSALPSSSSTPASSPPQSTQFEEFTSALTKKKNTIPSTISELTLIADQSLNSTTPTYLEGTPLTGRVSLSLSPSKRRSIRDVTLTVRGSILSLEHPGDPLHFLTIQRKLWTAGNGTPNSTPDTSLSADNAPAATPSAHSPTVWPFSIDLPREVVFPSGRHVDIFKLPHSFVERQAKVNICYEVSLRVRRGRFKTDYRLKLPFNYIPSRRPPPPSLPRQLAYLHRTPIPTPEEDIDGWHTAPTFNVRGQLAIGRQRSNVAVSCQLSLPKPLVYTRGTPLHLSLLLESPCAHALDVLSDPRSIVCRLRRTIRYRPSQRHQSPIRGTNFVDSHASLCLRDLNWNSWKQKGKDQIEDSESAVWWPCHSQSDCDYEPEPDDHHQQPRQGTVQKRRIAGELHLRKDLKPTTAIGDFSIEYSLVLFPFDNTSFIPNPTVSTGTLLHKEALISIPIEIATLDAPGPQPRMYAPPCYDSTDTHYVSWDYNYSSVA
ncbi:hypothetical protein CC1G_10944 [Coprinopsis cinerea okayama7|uniref:Arrestin-like N-terminal domain-containing protein n=1 Tax=Coprinopsis cinerea (strain Okayama-7 / 130 / ATCC MYA-4618 / FGSC 9003) TaxID=240176 RepID=A8NT58_COPC7|nr:hypothetical protein CC1G_10944 [Coprinopsis cinerea okayama7\|eukprot:XP_001836163.1 hypothetical protein CC1G_10944 [Coprinopsis cinerea okayama7\